MILVAREEFLLILQGYLTTQVMNTLMTEMMLVRASRNQSIDKIFITRNWPHECLRNPKERHLLGEEGHSYLDPEHRLHLALTLEIKPKDHWSVLLIS